MPPARRWLPILALLACLQPAFVAAGPDAGMAEARAWLARIHAAARAGNYEGTMVFSVGGVMSSSRVGHYAVGDQVYEHLEALDGRMQRILRHNDAVHTVLPQSRVTVIEKRQTLAAWATTPQQVDPQALEEYGFRREGMARVAGREAVVILLEPRDRLRYPQRLWADKATGLLLRADVIGLEAGAGSVRPVLESTAFSEVAIGVRPQAQEVIEELRKLQDLEGYRVLRPLQERTALESEGWMLSRPVDGFKLAGCVRRGMDNGGEALPVLQAVFTDGLTHVSLFIERYKPQRHRTEMQAQRGATATLMQRLGDHWVTVVGDVPLPTLSLFVDAVTQRRP